MMQPASEKPTRRKGIVTPYTVVWSMLGALGLGYLVVAVFAPAWLSGLIPVAERADRQSAEPDPTMVTLPGDVDDLKFSVKKLLGDVAAVKADVESQGNQTQQLGQRVSALEEKIQQPQTSSSAGDAVAPQAADSAAPEAAVTEPAAKPAAPIAKVINPTSSSSAQIETGSVDSGAGTSKGSSAPPAAISFGPAIVKPAAKPIGVLVGSGPTVDGLRMSWTQLSESNDKLKKLKPRYSENGDFKNPNFNLIAGPVKTKAEAIKLCKDLAAHDVSCKVGEFKGEEL